MIEANAGTKPVADQHAFDIAALERYLADRLQGFRGPLSVEQFKGGQSNPTFKLITPERAYVMRSKPGPAAKLLPSAHAIDREFRVMSALHETDVPVPRMHLLCEDESVIGRAFYVMEFMPGRVLWDQSLPAFDRAGRGRIYDEMNRVIAALHAVDVKEWASRRTGSPATTSSARSDAGASSTSHRSPSRSTRWTG
jgi:aminoglycoside phosphotransferase (APT) family kinase protein